tara:strand:+ start:2154 stop:2606 length:453 start_codon:yes stop_codon:yes gene_type:complete
MSATAAAGTAASTAASAKKTAKEERKEGRKERAKVRGEGRAGRAKSGQEYRTKKAAMKQTARTEEAEQRRFDREQRKKKRRDKFTNAKLATQIATPSKEELGTKIKEMKTKAGQKQAFKRKVKKAKRSVTTASKGAPETKKWTGHMVEKE